MKLLHIIPSIDPKSGGPAKAVVSYANMASSFAEVVLVATNEGFEKYVDSDHIKEAIGLNREVKLHLFAFKGKHSYKYSKQLNEWLDENLHTFDRAHLHAAFSITTTIAARKCREYDVPYVFRPLGTLSPYSMHYRSSFVKKLYYRYFDSQTLEGAIALQATSRQEEQELQRYAKEKQPVFVIPIPMENRTDQPKKKHSDPLRIGYLGRLHPKKNLESLFDAVYHYSKDHSLVLFIGGDGDAGYKNQLKKQVSNLGLSDYVDWLGFVNEKDKEEFFDNIDFFILPSFHENFGVSVIESLSYGRPVLISPMVDAIHWVNAYQCGIDCGIDETDILLALNKAHFVEENSYEYMSENALRLVNEEFSPNKIVKKLKQLYQWE